MSRMLKTPMDVTVLLQRAIEIALVLLLVLVGVRMVFGLRSTDRETDLAPASTLLDQPLLIDEASYNDNYSVLVLANPFLGQDRGRQIDEEAVLNAPETSLNLALKGVRAVGEGKGVAYVLLPDGRQVLTRVGAEILDGVVVEYVFEDRITLRTRDGLETLYWRDPDNRALFVRPIEASVEVDDDLQFVLHGTGISAKRFVSDVSLTRVKDSGVPVGYRLTPKRQSGALQAAGFQNGDIILEVNEFPVSEIDLEDMQDLLLAATVFEFYIERGERTERVIVEFAQGVDN